VAAAYRALAKKYHPDRSSARDAMQRMAQINVAYQALRARTGALAAGAPVAANDLTPEPVASFTREHVDPAASLEQVMAVVARKVEAARQQLVDEIVRDGLPHDTASNLVRQTLRDSSSSVSSGGSTRARQSGSQLRPDTSYDQALAIVTARAEAARNELADALVHDGLQRTTAVELVDSAFESVRRRPAASAQRETRLSPDHLHQDSSLEHGLEVATDKLRVAVKLVVDELARDGVPQQTAHQLTQAALDGMATARRR
jgi:curved DNA-binding protein CbpA